ncbi:MAG: hypothetical protein HWQ41_00570 [Nostoc sp. NOS(2021)]|uniref:hypothetical protein n=1 Tax=Nostoc sp. NOS(2021) TaxID=2815407 RepID=UPI0025D31A18|nr:hypothetical protein [Nostoc sp. NOS(2021)]MBN3893836.1 hypothetical protein [Nostoc sp. NOS(2021)]
MSLSDFIELPDVKARFKAEFPKPKLDVKQGILAAAPNGSDVRLVGTAYDYLLRFYIKYQNPHAQELEWIAEYALRHFNRRGQNDLFNQAKNVIDQARNNYQEFLTNGQFTNELLQSALLLGRLDAVMRAGYIHDAWSAINQQDIQDLRNLVSLLKPDLFKSSEKTILNPTWPNAARLVRAADGDLILDDLLVDFKTLKELKLGLRDFHQLMGYYTLSVIQRTLQEDAIELKRLAIYYSRFAVLYQINVKDVVNFETFPSFLDWFIERAQRYSGYTLIN